VLRGIAFSPPAPGTKGNVFGYAPMSKPKPQDEDPRETPLNDPRQKTDWPNTKQTNEPWKGPVEKEQQNKTDIDLEKWQESDTH
jgi:hypothetical protein